MQGGYAHGYLERTRLAIAAAIWAGARPKARINSSYVPEWMNCGRPSAPSVLMEMTLSAPPAPCGCRRYRILSRLCRMYPLFCSARHTIFPEPQSCSSRSASIEGMSTTPTGRPRVEHSSAAASASWTPPPLGTITAPPPALPHTTHPLPTPTVSPPPQPPPDDVPLP